MIKTVYTTNEAADELGVSAARVRQMVLDGSLPAEKFGRDLVISAKALALARQRKTTPGPEPKAQPAPRSAKQARKGGRK